jgi:hypothetical protein
MSPFNLKEGGYGFLFRSEFFFRTPRELEYLFFCRARREFFFQNSPLLAFFFTSFLCGLCDIGTKGPSLLLLLAFIDPYCVIMSIQCLIWLSNNLLSCNIMITIQYKQMTKKINRVSALVHPTPYEIEKIISNSTV